MNGDTGMTVSEALRTLCRNGSISEFDLQFAEALARTVSTGEKEDIDQFRVIAALASHSSFTKQSACIDIEALAFEQLFSDQEYEGNSSSLYKNSKLEKLEENRKAKEILDNVLGENRSALMNGLFRKYPEIICMAESFDAEVPFVPLIWIAPRLYLHRFWNYEKELAEILIRTGGEPDGKTVSESEIRSYFELIGKNDPDDDGQWKAVQLALKKKLSIITGGPGTGKTTIVSAILAKTLKENPDARISLCAPTGKAQARLLESIRETNENKNAKITEIPASTIHRLLKYNHHTGKFRMDAESPLDTDLVILDEASMVSLPMMVRLMRAVPKNAKIILLGDADQLASVEAGAVLSDICEHSGQSGSKWKNNVARLTKNHRFIGKGAIGILKLKESINKGSDEDVIGLLREAKDGVVSWGLFNGKRLPSGRDELIEALVPHFALWKDGYLKAENITLALDKFKEFQVLCSHRGGLFGTNSLNKLIRKSLGKTKSYDRGVPVMITRNNYEHCLFNGDIGLCWPDESGNIKVYFPDPEQACTLRKFSPSMLPEHEDSFAMTVHKSQGSGFGQVLLILPDSKESPILTRELLYTGVTRTKEKVTIWATEHALRATINKKTVRASGLKERLKE